METSCKILLCLLIFSPSLAAGEDTQPTQTTEPSISNTSLNSLSLESTNKSTYQTNDPSYTDYYNPEGKEDFGMDGYNTIRYSTYTNADGVSLTNENAHDRDANANAVAIDSAPNTPINANVYSAWQDIANPNNALYYNVPSTVQTNEGYSTYYTTQHEGAQSNNQYSSASYIGYSNPAAFTPYTDQNAYFNFYDQATPQANPDQYSYNPDNGQPTNTVQSNPIQYVYSNQPNIDQATLNQYSNQPNTDQAFLNQYSNQPNTSSVHDADQYVYSNQAVKTANILAIYNYATENYESMINQRFPNKVEDVGFSTAYHHSQDANMYSPQSQGVYTVKTNPKEVAHEEGNGRKVKYYLKVHGSTNYNEASAESKHKKHPANDSNKLEPNQYTTKVRKTRKPSQNTQLVKVAHYKPQLHKKSKGTRTKTTKLLKKPKGTLVTYFHSDAPVKNAQGSITHGRPSSHRSPVNANGSAGKWDSSSSASNRFPSLFSSAYTNDLRDELQDGLAPELTEEVLQKEEGLAPDEELTEEVEEEKMYHKHVHHAVPVRTKIIERPVPYPVDKIVPVPINKVKHVPVAVPYEKKVPVIIEKPKSTVTVHKEVSYFDPTLPAQFAKYAQAYGNHDDYLHDHGYHGRPQHQSRPYHHHYAQAYNYHDDYYQPQHSVDHESHYHVHHRRPHHHDNHGRLQHHSRPHHHHYAPAYNYHDDYSQPQHSVHHEPHYHVHHGRLQHHSRPYDNHYAPTYSDDDDFYHPQHATHYHVYHGRPQSHHFSSQPKRYSRRGVDGEQSIELSQSSYDTMYQTYDGEEQPFYEVDDEKKKK